MAETSTNPPAQPGAGAGTAPKLRLPDKVHCWPHLVRSEFLCSVLVTIVLVVWSIVLNAPLEEPSNPTKTPNPSKAPWYFLGLQEMLVYFDPWMAGVVLPTFIIIGLMVIPYIDVNPKGNGYYTFSERKFAITIFLFGFLVLWISLIIIGTFFRGPGWYLFWPWEAWDPHKTVALTNVNLPYTALFKWLGNPRVLKGLFPPGIELIGLVLVNVYIILPTIFFWKKFGNKVGHTIERMGFARYFIVSQLFLIMMALPIKMVLRLGFNIKYVWVTPWFNI